MDPRSLQYVARTCGGELRGGSPGALVRRICTDSRAVQTGDLFVALRGERFDGHSFLPQAAAQGIIGALVDSTLADAEMPCPAIVVDNTRIALGRMAAAYRAEFDLPVIAIGGSNGKTTTKELLAGVLRQRFVTLASEASFNNDIGVPLTLLRLEQQHQMAVVEVGTNHPGELAPLLRMVRPQLGIITSLGREHLEHFGDMTGVCQEEGALAEALPSDGVLYFGADNAWGEALLRRTQATVVRVGLAEPCDWRVRNVSLSRKGVSFDLASPQREFKGRYRVGLLGEHQAVNAAFAIAVGAQMGLSRSEIQAGLESAKPPPMRMQMVDCGGISVLDDCYNANADSMLAALRTLSGMPCSGSRVAVLGDMAELGAHTEAAHVEVGRRAAQSGLAQLLVVGEMASVTASAAREAGLHRVLEFESVDALADALPKLVNRGDLVLLKASRRMRLEQAVAKLCGGEPPGAH